MKNIKKIAKARDMSLTSLAVKLEVSQEAISQYISGKIKPRMDVIIKMSNIFDTTTDYLLDLTDDPTKKSFNLDEKEYNLIMNYRHLNNDNKTRLEIYAKALMDIMK